MGWVFRTLILHSPGGMWQGTCSSWSHRKPAAIIAERRLGPWTLPSLSAEASSSCLCDQSFVKSTVHCPAQPSQLHMSSLDKGRELAGAIYDNMALWGDDTSGAGGGEARVTPSLPLPIVGMMGVQDTGVPLTVLPLTPHPPSLPVHPHFCCPLPSLQLSSCFWCLGSWGSCSWGTSSPGPRRKRVQKTVAALSLPAALPLTKAFSALTGKTAEHMT